MNLDSKKSFINLGFVNLMDNSVVRNRQRERKEIFIDNVGNVLKFQLGENHKINLNKYNQVALISIDLFGEYLNENPEVFIPDTSSVDTLSEIDDSSLYSYQDNEMIEIICNLENRKREAVSVEDFDQAKTHRDLITYLRKVSEKLGNLEMEKHKAVLEENYEHAKTLKDNINTFRQSIYDEIRSKNLEDCLPDDRKHDNLSDKSESVSEESIKEKKRPPLKQEEISIKENYKKSEDNSVKFNENKISNENREIRRLIYPPDFDKIESPFGNRDPNSRNRGDDRPLPALSRKSFAYRPSVDLKRPIFFGEKEMDSESIMNEPALEKIKTPLLSLHELNSNNHNNENFDTISYDDTETMRDRDYSESLEQMSETQIRQAGLAIETFGLAIVAKIYSKVWSKRDEAINELQTFLQNHISSNSSRENLSDRQNSIDYPDPKTILRAISLLLVKLLNDSVLAVFRKSVILHQFLLVNYAEAMNIPKSEILGQIDKLFVILLGRTGDNAARVRELARANVVAMSNWRVTQCPCEYWLQLLKPISPATLERLALSRVEIVNELYTKLVKKHADITFFKLDQISQFSGSVIQHKSAEVRESGANLILELYMNNKKVELRQIIRSYLPKDDAQSRKNHTMKRLFTKLDKIDDKSAENPKIIKKPSVLTSSTLQNQQKLMKGRRISKVSMDGSVKSVSNTNNKSVMNRNVENKSSVKSVKQTIPKNLNIQEIEEIYGDELFMENTCIFCGITDDSFTPEGLDQHYLKTCAMLKRCQNCKQVVEISAFTEHLLLECKSGNTTFEKCPKCLEAVVRGNLSNHLTSENCKKCPNPVLRCPLCHVDLPSSSQALIEDIWKAHLLGSAYQGQLNVTVPFCHQNQRRSNLNSINNKQPTNNTTNNKVTKESTKKSLKQKK